MKGDNMEEDTKSNMRYLIERAIDFEKRMAAIEIKSLERQLNFFEKRYHSLFAFMNEEQPALVGIWIDKMVREEIAAQGVEEE